MKVRYYIDPATDLPHIYRHDVSELEVVEVLEGPAEDYFANEASRVAIGPTSTERTLRVIYASDPNSVFVIMAYDLRGKPLLAHRRRRRRKHP